MTTCPKSQCGGNLLPQLPGSGLRCPKCGSAFVNARAVELERLGARLQAMRAELRMIGRGLRARTSWRSGADRVNPSGELGNVGEFGSVGPTPRRPDD